MTIFYENTEEDKYRVTVRQFPPVVTKGDAAKLLEKQWDPH